MSRTSRVPLHAWMSLIRPAIHSLRGCPVIASARGRSYLPAVADTIRAFAEQVLFSTDLGLKLAAPPSRLMDPQLGGSTAFPAFPTLPGRPAELRWKERGEPCRFPAQIGSDRERGLLLHHMANHELLAVELMALALLKFPDAPAPFRRGLLATLAEEQAHTCLYLDRMQACGVSFGTLPVSGFFWRMIAPMTTPMDYVTRLSLTFEQANLDYARAYAALFERLGDPDTAALFDRIHTDEIGHVGYGLHWFRKWKDPARSDWEEFRARLPAQIPAARARGIGFDPEGRARAGFDPEFIRLLRIEPVRPTHPVVVHWMNAGPDTGESMPARVTHALALLPVAWMREGDGILTDTPPGPAWMEFLATAGLPVPRCVAPGSGWEGPVSHLDPWAWTPAAAACEADLNPRQPHAPSDPIRLESLFLKSSAPPLLVEVADLMGLTGPGAAPGRFAASAMEVEAIRSGFAAMGFDRCVVKALRSCAGRDRRRLPPFRAPHEGAWLQATLARDGAVLVEPWFDRVLDFSIQFSMDAEGARVVGTTEMRNTPAGAWQASIQQPVLASGTPLARFLHSGRPSLLNRLVSTLADTLPRAFKGTGYRGAAGVDAFLFRGPDGTIGLRPVVELNPRRTMGRVLIDAMRRAGSGRVGRLQFEAGPALAGARTGSGSCHVHRDPSGSIASARIPLADPATARRVPVLEIGSALDAFTTEETTKPPRT